MTQSTLNTPTRAGRTGRWVLAATIVGSSMAFIDATIIIVALPVLQADLKATVTDVQWIVEAYVLFMAALILVGGSLGDRYGRRLIYLLGVVIFATASMWAGLAPNPDHLIASRVLQGIGAALLVPNSLAIISAFFRKQARGKAIGTWSAFTAVTTALGPVAGGWLVENISWRWAFYINVPFAIIVVVACLWRVPESRDEYAPHTLDWWGALLATLGLGGLTFGFVEMSNLGWNDPRVLAALSIGVIGLILFILAEARSPTPMVPLALFRSWTFSGANLLTFWLYAAVGGLLFFLPFNLIQVQGYGPTASGAAFLPMILVIATLSRWAGGLGTRYGAKWLLVIGSLIAALGFALFTLPGIGGSYWLTFFPPMVILGLGMAISVPPLTTVVMSNVEDRLVGTASGVNNAISRAAGLLAVAVLGVFVLTVFNQQLDIRIATLRIPPAAQAQFNPERIRLAEAKVPDSLDEETKADLEQAINESFVVGFRWVAVICSLMAIMSAVTALFTIEGTYLSITHDERRHEMML